MDVSGVEDSALGMMRESMGGL
ncbi:hypothetical protein IL54_0361 [Sphingobium sp. ba1]|nr:hypothetical protein IL54_0361 [Sphingobium sp. ba1]